MLRDRQQEGKRRGETVKKEKDEREREMLTANEFLRETQLAA